MKVNADEATNAISLPEKNIWFQTLILDKFKVIIPGLSNARQDHYYKMNSINILNIFIEATLRKKAAKELQVRDEKGRQRFHGAFTGGFSAGYFNTVGTKEGMFWF